MNLQDIHYKRDISWKAVEALRTFEYFQSLAEYIDEKTFSSTRWRCHRPAIYIYPMVLSAMFIREVVMPYVRKWEQEQRRFSDEGCEIRFHEGVREEEHCIIITMYKEEIKYLKDHGIIGW